MRDPFEETEVAGFLGVAPMHTSTFSKLLSLCRILQLYSKAEVHRSHNYRSKLFKLDLDTGIYTSPSALLEMGSIPHTYREDACVCEYMVFPFKATHLVSGSCALKETTSGARGSAWQRSTQSWLKAMSPSESLPLS